MALYMVVQRMQTLISSEKMVTIVMMYGYSIFFVDANIGVAQENKSSLWNDFSGHRMAELG